MIATGFTGSWLDRADAVRHDDAALAALGADPGARLLVLDAGDPQVGADGRLAWQPVAELGELLFLGLHDGVPHFAPLLAAHGTGAARSPALFALLDRLAPGDAAVFGTARALLSWHTRHRFCANCGGVTAPIRGGWARRCAVCGTEHFPRTDPVVIMVVEHDGRALLGRQTAWPPRRYSALAGFVEPGESVEEAVAREVQEEAGVRVRDVRYLASQPWPFPGQLMIGAVAQADDPTLTVDTRELEDAIWVTRAELAAALRGDADARFLPPPAYAIARTLLEAWVTDAPAQAGA
ncbi:NAD+ diphosphatase [Sphingomonas guangdongensis]|uniref:NAD(+) diphosphatase n=1 Tax=Sphingomonas guangdongensis TaxID=1141890 RepID=A0A285QGI6_9SPHN|nr:NAD(+) diphosphatase [Sphingomonas guangdongensis]SOB80956.1 NAD+ diphosphatase [Sphingomonas guangdongensis]